MALNDTQIKNAKARNAAYKLTDERGLCLLVNPNGSKWWRFRYRVDGREKMISLGVYPDVGLKRAREKRDEARRQVADSVDPSAERKTQRAARSETFEVVAREWFDKQSKTWKATHADKIIGRLEKNIFPNLGSRPIRKIDAQDVLRCLRKIESRNAVDTAHRTKQNCSSVFGFAIATGRADNNPCTDLKGALAPAKSEHFATITDPPKIGALLRAIDGYDGYPVVRAAFKLIPLVFVRPGELRGAEWSEINVEAAEWRIRADRMKMGVQHVVPLASQSIEIIEELRELTGSGKFLFPSPRSTLRSISDNALTAALRRMGYQQGSMTIHGFRSMASTLLNEQQFNRDWIERQLAHDDRDGVRSAYNFAQYLPERRKMMQHWADYLDGLRAGNVVNIGRDKVA